MGWGKRPESLYIVILTAVLLHPVSSVAKTVSTELLQQAETLYNSNLTWSDSEDSDYFSESNNPTQILNDLKNQIGTNDRIRVHHLTSLLERPPEAEKSFATDHFRLHYDLSGENAITHNEDISFIAEAGAACELCWTTYHTDQNWPEPKCDEGAGGDDLIDVYFVNLGPGIFGYAMHEDLPEKSGDTGFIVLNSDYRDSAHLTAAETLRTTIAHEYHHLIQFSFGYNSSDQWFMEQISMMEESLAFTDIHDARRYLQIYTNHPYRSLDLSNGTFEYGAWLWPLYIAERWGWDFLISVWQLRAENSSLTMLDALDQSFAGIGASLNEAFLEWTTWNAFLGERSDTRHYQNGNEYLPGIVPDISLSTYPVVDLHPSTTRQIQPLGASYIAFSNQSNSADNTITISVSGGDNLFGGHIVAWDHQGMLVEDRDLALSDGQLTCTVHQWDSIETMWLILTAGSESHTTTDFSLFASTEYTSGAEVDPDLISAGSLQLTNAPNPFCPLTKIYFTVDTETRTSLRIFDIEGRMIKQLADATASIGEHAVLWNGQDDNGNQVAAGVYYCLLQTPAHQARIRMIRMQ